MMADNRLDFKGALCLGPCQVCEAAKFLADCHGRTIRQDPDVRGDMPMSFWDSFEEFTTQTRDCAFAAFLSHLRTTAQSQELDWKPAKSRQENAIVSLYFVQTSEPIDFSDGPGIEDHWDLRFSSGAFWTALGLDGFQLENASFAVRRIPPLFDFSAAKSWFRHCEMHDHSERLHEPKAFAPGMEFRVIDVELQAVVEPEGDVEYVALSYVWGTQAQALLTSETRNLLMTPGGLAGENTIVSRTIIDAMQVTASLGLRYLWVDALCIKQDDEKDKNVQINCMDNIYARSFLTIVSTSPSVHHGIPGLPTRPRSQSQHAFELDQGARLLQRCLGANKAVDETRWASRGWTLQEYLLSPRIIYFTDRQAIYQCSFGQGVMYYEDQCLPTPELAQKLQVTQYREFPIRRLFMPRSLSRATITSRYSSFMFMYGRRDLTNPIDNINGLTGALKLVGDCHWGIPKKIFPQCLFWICETHSASRNENYPSWSWASAKTNGASFEQTAGTPDPDTPDIYIIDNTSSEGCLHELLYTSMKCGCQEQGATPCPTHSAELSRLDHDLNSQPQLVRQISKTLPRSTLAIRCEFQTLFVESNEARRIRLQTPNTLKHHLVSATESMEEPMGSILLDEEWRSSRGPTMDFIALTKWRLGVNCLLVEWDGGIARRVQGSWDTGQTETSYLLKQRWEAAKPEVKLVLLA